MLAVLAVLAENSSKAEVAGYVIESALLSAAGRVEERARRWMVLGSSLRVLEEAGLCYFRGGQGCQCRGQNVGLSIYHRIAKTSISYSRLS